jgi:hypothetical protein
MACFLVVETRRAPVRNSSPSLLNPELAADRFLLTAGLMTRPFAPRVSSESASEADSVSLDRGRKIG